MAAKINKAFSEAIDETFLLNSIAEQGIVKEAPKPPPESVIIEDEVETIKPVPEPPKEVKDTKETGKRKRNSGNVDYGSQFLYRNEIKTRQCVYISQRIHATISEIVKIIADKELSVGGYIDSILHEHLESHKDEIRELYNKELEKKNRKNFMDFLL